VEVCHWTQGLPVKVCHGALRLSLSLAPGSSSGTWKHIYGTAFSSLPMLLYYVAFYMVLMFLMGAYFSRRIKSTGDFYVAGRKLGLAAASSTIAATTIGGSATIVVAKVIYESGLPGIWYDLAGGVGLIVLGLAFAASVRRFGVYSLPEMIERMYDRRSRTVAAVLVIIAEIAWIALLLQALRFVMSVVLTDVDPDRLMLYAAVVFIGYTLVGGQYSVAYTDLIQFTIMFVGIVLIVAPLALMEAGGLDALRSDVPAGSYDFPTSRGLGTREVFSIFLLMFLPHLVGSDIYSKLYSSRDESTAKRAAVLAGAAKIVFGVAIAVVALSAIALSNQPGSDFRPSYPAEIIPLMITDVAPEWLGGIILAAFIATMMSSADSCLLTSGVVCTNDLLGPCGFTEENYQLGRRIEGIRHGALRRVLRFAAGNYDLARIMVSRLAIVAFGYLGYRLAVHEGDILDTLELAYTVFAAGIIVPVIAGFYKERLGITDNGALAAFFVGGASALFWLKVLPEFYGELAAELDAVIVGVALCSAVLLINSLTSLIRGRPANP